MRLRLLSVTLLCPLVVAACASSEPSPSGDRPAAAPVREGRPANPGTKASRSASPSAGTGTEFTHEERAFMDSAMRAFRKHDPEWPALRDEWLTMGEMATNVLVENLFNLMLIARFRNYPEGYAIARRELLRLGDPTVPFLAGVLEFQPWVDAAGRAHNLPTEVVNEIAEILMVSEDAARPHFLRLARNEVLSVRRAAIQALGRIGGEGAVEVCVGELRGGDNWADRMVAARALSGIEDERATRALIEGLSDGDTSVQIECARALAVKGATSALEALDRRREAARIEGDHRVAAACGSAAKVIREGQ